MPGDYDIQRALEIQLQLRRVFDLHAGGSKDRSGLQRVRELCDLAARATTDQYCRGKLGQVEDARRRAVFRSQEPEMGAQPKPGRQFGRCATASSPRSTP
jgi:hypothetical protein